MTDQEKLCEAGNEIRFIRDLLEQLERKLREGCDEPPVEPPTMRIGPPLDTVVVRRPGTLTVLKWPVVIDLDITARIAGDNIRISWPDELGDWPATTHDLSADGDRPYIGVTGWIYFADGQWWAYPAEYVRPDREATGTYWNWKAKFVQAVVGEPDADTLIGIFVAGMWRHMTNSPRYQRRTKVKWFTWPELELVGSE